MHREWFSCKQCLLYVYIYMFGLFFHEISFGERNTKKN